MCTSLWLTHFSPEISSHAPGDAFAVQWNSKWFQGRRRAHKSLEQFQLSPRFMSTPEAPALRSTAALPASRHTLWKFHFPPLLAICGFNLSKHNGSTRQCCHSASRFSHSRSVSAECTAHSSQLFFVIFMSGSPMRYN